MLRTMYAADGLAGLADASRPGGPKTVLTGPVIAEILTATVTPPPQALHHGRNALVIPAARGLAAPD